LPYTLEPGARCLVIGVLGPASQRLYLRQPCQWSSYPVAHCGICRATHPTWGGVPESRTRPASHVGLIEGSAHRTSEASRGAWKGKSPPKAWATAHGLGPHLRPSPPAAPLLSRPSLPPAKASASATTTACACLTAVATMTLRGTTTRIQCPCPQNLHYYPLCCRHQVPVELPCRNWNPHPRIGLPASSSEEQPLPAAGMWSRRLKSSKRLRVYFLCCNPLFSVT
jgi:hypothetical protein